MKTWAITFLAWLQFAGICWSHEYWLGVEDAYPLVGEAVEIYIRSGHAFPSSETLLAEHLLSELEVAGPEGPEITYEPVARGDEWVAAITPDRAGVWVLSFALTRPRQAEPLHRGRSLVIAGGKDDPSRYRTGKGLEIVPLAALSDLRAGDTLPVSLFLDRTPIAGRITVIPEDEPVAFMSCGAGRPAQVRLKKAGRYLLSASNQGRTCSLTIVVSESAVDGNDGER